ncbi:hypothetical protein B0F90DRAFT_1779403 [Multifurca ochricompacta]|uniref:Uncharacterized protein n=1 Tax=Multifurca ochricompacta TaxID=376703 RepID=A0AAD4QJ44_9AGAM|nr:hypothetical protein B0F90DRAFT_1779403 [Multifurca ochricompacta]
MKYSLCLFSSSHCVPQPSKVANGLSTFNSFRWIQPHQRIRHYRCYRHSILQV